MQLAAAALLVAGTVSLLGLYTGQNFADYLHSRNTEIFEEAAEDIAKRYAKSGDLTAAAKDIHALRPARKQHSRTGTRKEAKKARKKRNSKYERSRAHGPRPPPAFLLDSTGQPLGSAPPDLGNMERTRIEADGELVGYLAWPRRSLPQELDDAFTSRQGRAYLLIGGAAILLAALLALILARRTARPVRELSAASAALARRDFSARVSVAGDDEIARLAADFNRLASALEGYDARQKQWLADVAHELRNPLAILRAQLDAILDGVRSPDARALSTLASEVTRLEALVDQLHLLSMAESGGLVLQLAPCEPAAIVETTVERYRQRFDAAGFELHCEIADAAGRQIIADRQRMESVIANLLENALRHASAPGPVVVACHESGNGIIISVSDAGPGVPDDMLPRLFDRLFRGDSARSGGGSGLGLAIVRSIVEAHGGAVTAGTNAAGGLEIQCHWPRRLPA